MRRFRMIVAASIMKDPKKILVYVACLVRLRVGPDTIM